MPVEGRELDIAREDPHDLSGHSALGYAILARDELCSGSHRFTAEAGLRGEVVGTPDQGARKELPTDHAPFPGRNAIDHKAGNERARVVASLRMDPDTYFQALSVMASNWNRFVEAHVPPQMRQPRFKLIDAGDMQLHGFKPEE